MPGSSDKQRVRKPRKVPLEERQRAVYSCDRCKVKKTKCIRSDPNNQEVRAQDKDTPCDNCIKAKMECVTSMPRRRRVYGSLENLGIHYQTLLSLVQGLYPDVDINDVNEIIKIGEEKGIKMDGTPAADKADLESKLLRPFIPKVDSSASLNDSSLSGSAIISPLVSKSNTPAIGNTLIPPKENYSVSETVIYDDKGGSHYVGSAGTPVLFSVLCNLLLKRSFRTTLSFDRDVKLFDNQLKPNDDQHKRLSEIIHEHKFPIIEFLTKQESLYYIDHFFQFFHPFYFMFDEKRFRMNHETYWDRLTGTDETTKISDADVGCIYLVWIIGSRLIDSSLRNPILESSKMDETLKIILSDVALNSNISTIQFLFLFAINLHANKNRDSAWNLIGLATRQAISIGLHRKMATKDKDTDLQIQVFWSLYQYELTLCSTFGRPSNINEDEIDIDYPDLNETPRLSREHDVYFVASLKLSRFLNKIVKDRKITSNQQPISLINIERTLSMKNQLNQIHKDLNIKPLSLISNIYEYKLNLRFHYYMVALILPFLIYITTTNFKVQEDETLLSIMKTGIQSAIMVSKLMKLSIEKKFNYGAISTDCMYGYSSTLVLSLFFIYLSNSSNDMMDLAIDFHDGINEVTEKIDKKQTFEYISYIIDFMHNSQLDSTTKRILEVIEGIKNDLQLVEIQDDLRFDTLNFEGTDQMVYDSLFMSNEIYLDGKLDMVFI